MVRVKRENKIVSLMGGTAERSIWCSLTKCETYLVGVQYDDIRPSGTAILEDFERLIVNAIEGMEVKGEDVRAMVCPISLGAALRNWTATNIPTIFLFSQ